MTHRLRTLVRRHDESTVVHRMADGESVPGSVCIHRFVNGHSQSGVKFISKELPSMVIFYSKILNKKISIKIPITLMYRIRGYML